MAKARALSDLANFEDAAGQELERACKLTFQKERSQAFSEKAQDDPAHMLPVAAEAQGKLRDLRHRTLGVALVQVELDDSLVPAAIRFGGFLSAIALHIPAA